MYRTRNRQKADPSDGTLKEGCANHSISFGKCTPLHNSTKVPTFIPLAVFNAITLFKSNVTIVMLIGMTPV